MVFTSQRKLPRGKLETMLHEAVFHEDFMNVLIELGHLPDVSIEKVKEIRSEVKTLKEKTTKQETEVKTLKAMIEELRTMENAKET